VDASSLRTFEFGGMSLYRRTTLVIRAGWIAKVFYPVFPPDEHAEEVLRWIR
jgi:peroxiredoxin